MVYSPPMELTDTQEFRIETDYSRARQSMADAFDEHFRDLATRKKTRRLADDLERPEER